MVTASSSFLPFSHTWVSSVSAYTKLRCAADLAENNNPFVSGTIHVSPFTVHEASVPAVLAFDSAHFLLPLTEGVQFVASASRLAMVVALNPFVKSHVFLSCALLLSAMPRSMSVSVKSFFISLTSLVVSNYCKFNDLAVSFLFL